MIKGFIAGAAVVALLLGGSGTFALWNDTAAVAGADITAGTLTVEAGEGVWTDQTEAAINIADYRIVPGDTLTYQTLLDVEALGDNIKALLSVDKGQLTANSDSAEDKALEKILKEYTDVPAVEESRHEGPAGPAPVRGDQSIDFELLQGSVQYQVIVTIKFPAEYEDDDAAKTGSVDLSELGVKLTQHL